MFQDSMWFDHVWVREAISNRKSEVEKADEGVLKWSGHTERKSEIRSEGGKGVRGDQIKDDGVKNILSSLGLNMHKGEKVCMFR